MLWSMKIKSVNCLVSSMKIKDVIKDGEAKLIANSKDVNSAKIILMHLFKEDSYQFLIDEEKEISTDIYTKYFEMIDEVIKGRPVQYVIGEEAFYGYNFIVNEDVLIPRFETEELVYNILNRIDESFEGYKNINIVDIGTGSGAIALTLKKEEPRLNMIATDISKSAIKVAKENSELLDIEIEFRVGDMVNPVLDCKFDIVVSNPPYIPKEDDIQSIVKDNEPHVALFGGKDGLDYYDIILKNIHNITNEEAMIAFEIGWNQAEKIRQLANKYINNPYIEVVQDIYGKDRMMFIYKK